MLFGRSTVHIEICPDSFRLRLPSEKIFKRISENFLMHPEYRSLLHSRQITIANLNCSSVDN